MNLIASPRSILITGASSGLGAALARHYAAAGAHVALVGRHEGRLAAVAADCGRLGGSAEARVADVVEAIAMAELIAATDRARPLDLVIANAGVSAGTLGGPESADQVRRLFAINIDGVVNTVQPAIEAMRPRGRGQIALVSSLAAFRGFPGAPTYCASKAAIKVWGEALRGSLHAEGLSVSVICPGFVESAMTAKNDFRMPLLMSAEKAARIVARGLARNRARIAFPWPLYAAVTLIGMLPPGLIDPLMRRLPAKAASIDA